MSDNETKIQRIKKFAFLYQYVIPGGAIVVPIAIALLTGENIQTSFFFWLGICAMIYGAYTVCGCLLGWKHICCAYQNMHNQRMTPEAECFEPDVKKGLLKMAGANLLMGAVLLVLVKL